MLADFFSLKIEKKMSTCTSYLHIIMQHQLFTHCSLCIFLETYYDKNNIYDVFFFDILLMEDITKMRLKIAY